MTLREFAGWTCIALGIVIPTVAIFWPWTDDDEKPLKVMAAIGTGVMLYVAGNGRL